MIVNFGSMNIDYVYSVDHFVTPGETLSSDAMQIFPGGKGLNQSIAIARSGGEVMHCGYIGNGGEFLKDLLADSGADISLLKSSDGSNGHAIIQVDKSGENCILLYGGTNLSMDEEYIDSVLEAAKEGSIVLFQNETSGIGYGIKKAKERGLKVAINPAPMNEKVLAYPLEKVDCLFVNFDEGHKLTGAEEPQDIIRAIKGKYHIGEIILTLGEKGAWYSGTDETFFIEAVQAERVVDTTAAGDTFVGYFLALSDKEFSAREAMAYAAKASAICVAGKGAAASIPEIRKIG